MTERHGRHVLGVPPSGMVSTTDMDENERRSAGARSIERRSTGEELHERRSSGADSNERRSSGAEPDEAIVDFRVAPQAHLSRVVREGVMDFARSHGVCEDDLAHFLTALGEALANAIEHARAEGPIVIEVRVRHDRILASVQDNGIGFASQLVVDPQLPTPDAERGRGLPIMRRCCDIFALNSSPGKGTAVVLGRYLRGPDPVPVRIVA